MGIICGAKKRRRRRGVLEDVDAIGLSFEVNAIKLYEGPSSCDQICTMFKIPDNRCDALCEKTYRRFLQVLYLRLCTNMLLFQIYICVYSLIANKLWQALMVFTKTTIDQLFSNTSKVTFHSANRVFEYEAGTLETSEVIVDCPVGMKLETTAEGESGTCSK